ncbi:MAG: DUF3012 domain-containing protein [Gammaproteobacteria bacterium]|nr:DUF3012 domain-containing protein [Gammaproteobacteria bacterium]
MHRLLPAALMALLLTACSPEVGSNAWCEALDEQPKGDWSANDAADYAKNCIFRKKKD